MQKDRVPGEPEKKELLKGKGRFGKENYLILVLVGVLLLVVAWPVNDEKKTTQSVQSDSEQATIDLQTDLYSGLTIKGENDFESDVDSIPSYARYLEESLEKLLSTMEGVGKVRVMVTLEGTGETIVEKDQNIKKNGSTEVDSAGGSRNTSDITEEETTVFFDSANGDAPIIKQKLAPRVAGVAVSAQGGGNAVIAGNIKKAIQALFGIDAHKIIIVKMITQ
ncbi:MAG: stage III sporulation protein AG [Suilimivivens sp.]|nr:stage III sporulation protein AG [Lachnospiraceae bacterium]MDY5871407.1 stage III sporulation protein AG [Lachnospiraceae bacterium]